jgi:DNA replication and repair protein RecF
MIQDIRLQHFRSYSDESFEFSPAVNIIVGPNASGKTNLLEAILVACRGTSYRARDIDMISFNEGWSRLDARTEDMLRTVKIIAEPALHKTYELDGKAYGRLTQAHMLPAVLFEPNHLTLLSGAPEQRRAYLDDILEQTTPGYATLRRNYRRTLAQRNALLKKSPHLAVGQMFAWNIRLSEQAGKIARARNELAVKLESRLGDLYQNLSHATTSVSLDYHSPLPVADYESHLVHQLETRLELDIVRGFTSVGPHREDLLVTFDDHPASETASRGEARTLVLALKILELEVLKEARGQTPILLLDDVFSELDGTRRRA